MFVWPIERGEYWQLWSHRFNPAMVLCLFQSRVCTDVLVLIWRNTMSKEVFQQMYTYVYTYVSLSYTGYRWRFSCRCVPSWQIVGPFHGRLSRYNTESLTIMDSVYGVCHAPSMLKTSFVDSENKYAHCSGYQRLICSPLPNSPYLYSIY